MKFNKKTFLILIFIILQIPILALSLNREIVKIVFFCPRNQNDMFWGQFVDFMQAAVDDLGMNLKIYYADGNHVKMIEQVRESIKNDKPSILLLQNFMKQGASIIKIGEEARVPSFIVNAGFQDIENMGKPRQMYQQWIGQLTPDDEDAGYTLANFLLQQASFAKDGKIHIAALSGNTADNASIERVKGLRRAIKNNNVQLKQIFSTDWSSNIAKQKFEFFKKGRYPEVSVVWAASDSIALGVIEGGMNMKLSVGKDIITGGIDWSLEGLNSVRKGEMSITLGGHFMEGAWAAILIYDYFNGIDFISESTQLHSKMAAITSLNVNFYLKKLSRENWSLIKFKKFSKSYNHELKKYNFSIQNLLYEIN